MLGFYNMVKYSYLHQKKTKKNLTRYWEIMKLHSRGLRSRMPFLGNRIFPDVILTVPNKKSPEWYCFLRFSGKGLEIRYYSRLSRVVVSSPVPSRLFPRFFLDFPEPRISLVPVPPIRELPSSLVSSRQV